MKKVIAICLTFLMMSSNVFAFETVSEQYIDSGLISSSFLKQGRESNNIVRYAPWLVNYAIQTEDEASAVKGGEGFQQISDIAISPADNNLMLLGTDTCGVWRSTDGGENWLSINDGINCWGVHDIIFHPTSKNVAYMIQGAPNTSTASNQIQARSTLDGLYKSVDGGKSWKQILNVNIRASLSTNRLMAFDDLANLYLLTGEGLLRTSDSGETWDVLYDFSENLGMVDLINNDLCISGDTIVFTNGTYGLFSSSDSGETWEVKNITSTGNLTAYGIDIDPENVNHWLACFGSPYYAVYETFNSGFDWTILPVDINFDATSGKYPVKIMYGKRGVDGTRNLYMLLSRTYTPLRVSGDDGKTWTEASYSTLWGDTYSPLYGNAISLEHQDADTIFLGVGTVLKSVDGGIEFTARNNPGFSGAYVEEIKFSDSGRLYLSVTDRGFYKSNDIYDGEGYPTFQHSRDMSYSSVGDVGIDPLNENHIIYAEASNSYALRESYDGGLSWSKIEGTGATTAPKLIKFHTEDENIIYSTHYTSKDGGTTWTANSNRIYAVSDVDNDIVYSYTGNKLYKSLNCGVTFEQIYAADWNITFVLPDNTNSNIVYVGIINGNIVKIENNQVTVMNSNNGLSNIAPYAMVQNPNDANHLVIGGQCVDYSYTNQMYLENYSKTPGLYETFDGGITWHVVKGMPSMRVVYSLAFSPTTNEIFVGGFTGGLIVYDYGTYKKYLISENSIDENFTILYNGVTRKVTVCGKINNENNENVYSTLLVMHGDVMPNNAKAADIAFIGQIAINANGEFEYTFTMPYNCKYGTYSVYLGGSDIYLPGVGEYDNSDFTIMSFDFEDTQTITATAKILNTTGADKKIVMFIAQYEEVGEDVNRLVDIKIEEHSCEGNSNVPVTKKITSSLNEQTDLYRAFLWSDDGTLKPLTSYIENKRNGE